MGEASPTGYAGGWKVRSVPASYCRPRKLRTTSIRDLPAFTARGEGPGTRVTHDQDAQTAVSRRPYVDSRRWGYRRDRIRLSRLRRLVGRPGSAYGGSGTATSSAAVPRTNTAAHGAAGASITLANSNLGKILVNSRGRRCTCSKATKALRARATEHVQPHGASSGCGSSSEPGGDEAAVSRRRSVSLGDPSACVLPGQSVSARVLLG